MTRPAALVLDGNTVKLRLVADRQERGTAVHVDWLRFTVMVRVAPAPATDLLFGPEPYNIWEAAAHRVHRALAELPDADHYPGAQAHQLATEVAAFLGDDFKVGLDVRKGHDFYKHRISIERNDQEVGWVGFGASSESPRQRAQARTLHVNLYGAACTFARSGWLDDMAALIDTHKGQITRCDLALDFFDGFPGGMQRIKGDYLAGLMNVGGREPKCNMLGVWLDEERGHGRSFYWGSKEAGKQTNAYEKGHQLFGHESGSTWVRIELRYGNKLRELPSDILRRPGDFFSGASDWHAGALALADQVIAPESIPCTPRLAIETVEAEVYRNLKWLRDTAAATFAMAVRSSLDINSLWDLVGTTKTPGRLRAFSANEIDGCFDRAVHRLKTGSTPGQDAQRLQPQAA